MSIDINHALKVYLGASKDGGYQPLSGEERLSEAFPRDYSRIVELITPYLEENQEPNWSKGDLIQETSRFASSLKQKFPELDSIAISALANRWSYGWK